MRKTLLVVALIGASFAGGAVVNGPGLAWVRNAVGLSTPGIEGNPFDESLDEPDPNDEDDDIEAPKKPVRAPKSTARRTPPQPDEPQPKPALNPTTPPPADTPATDDAHLAGWGDAPGSAPSRAFVPPARDAEVARAEAPQKPADPNTPPTLEPPASTAAAAVDDTMTPLLEPTDEAARWADLAERMKTLGVRRFWVEGEPGGTITFRCAVPLVGRSAVAQQFEADGPDVCTAAESALKRAALWQATEAP